MSACPFLRLFHSFLPFLAFLSWLSFLGLLANGVSHLVPAVEATLSDLCITQMHTQEHSKITLCPSPTSLVSAQMYNQDHTVYKPDFPYQCTDCN